MRRLIERSILSLSLSQVADTPQEIPFLSVLQHLLRLDPKDAASDLAWDIAETLVHRATLLESREDATKLLRSPSLQVSDLTFRLYSIISRNKNRRKSFSITRRFATSLFSILLGVIRQTITRLPFLPSSTSESFDGKFIDSIRSATFADYAIAKRTSVLHRVTSDCLKFRDHRDDHQCRPR